MIESRNVEASFEVVHGRIRETYESDTDKTEESFGISDADFSTIITEKEDGHARNPRTCSSSTDLQIQVESGMTRALRTAFIASCAVALAVTVHGPL